MLTATQTRDLLLRQQVTRDLLATLRIVMDTCEAALMADVGLDHYDVKELARRVGKALAREEQAQRRQAQGGGL